MKAAHMLLRGFSSKALRPLQTFPNYGLLGHGSKAGPNMWLWLILFKNPVNGYNEVLCGFKPRVVLPHKHPPPSPISWVETVEHAVSWHQWQAQPGNPGTNSSEWVVQLYSRCAVSQGSPVKHGQEIHW